MTFYYPLPQIKKSIIKYDCDKCGLCDSPKINTPYFPAIKGKNYNGLVILGQQPSSDDDKKQMPFVDKKSQAIRSTSFKEGFNLNKVGAFTYAMQCYSPKKATDVQFKCCRKRMEIELKDLKPKLIICCGEMAFKSLFDLKNKIAPTKLRGRLIPNFEFNCLVYTVMNPIDLFTFDQQNALKRDLKRALKFWSKYSTYKKVDEFLKDRKILEGITIKEIKSVKQLESMIVKLKTIKRVAFDFEATNVKPYDYNFEITHVQFGIANYAWVINESAWQNEYAIFSILKEFLIDWLQNPKYEKIIQNAKFEENCARWVFGIKKIVNVNDPMLASHIIDERRGCTSLDFQNLMRFGIPPYSDTVKSFLMKREKDDKVNRIREAPYDDMIQYAGLDVITTYGNWELLKRFLPLAYPNAEYNYKFLLRGHQVFSNMTKSGIKVGEDELNGLEELLNEHMDKVLNKIGNIPEFIQYNNYLQDKTNIKKSTNKELKALSVNMKGDGKYDGQNKTSDSRKGKPIRRKLSF